ncbi:uncharacterized protein [Lepisosteus oculatus]|uniref:uncharacterized protein n=1 Tax=Lepisosteus oculatus TaxID=7918 RepID=UPI0035F52157
MASRSSPRKSLKNLFSKSEVNLQEVEDKEAKKGRSFKKLFKIDRSRKKKKDAESDQSRDDQSDRADQIEGEENPHNSLENNEEKWPNVIGSKKTSIYSTAPRSKKGSLSYSESELHKSSKSKKFGTFTFGWRKKKKDITKSSINLDFEETFEKSVTGTTEDLGNGESAQIHDSTSEMQEETVDASQSRHVRFQSLKSPETLPNPEVEASISPDLNQLQAVDHQEEDVKEGEVAGKTADPGRPPECLPKSAENISDSNLERPVSEEQKQLQKKIQRRYSGQTSNDKATSAAGPLRSSPERLKLNSSVGGSSPVKSALYRALSLEADSLSTKNDSTEEETRNVHQMAEDRPDDYSLIAAEDTDELWQQGENSKGYETAERERISGSAEQPPNKASLAVDFSPSQEPLVSKKNHESWSGSQVGNTLAQVEESTRGSSRKSVFTPGSTVLPTETVENHSLGENMVLHGLDDGLGTSEENKSETNESCQQKFWGNSSFSNIYKDQLYSDELSSDVSPTEQEEIPVTKPDQDLNQRNQTEHEFRGDQSLIRERNKDTPDKKSLQNTHPDIEGTKISDTDSADHNKVEIRGELCEIFQDETEIIAQEEKDTNCTVQSSVLLANKENWVLRQFESSREDLKDLGQSGPAPRNFEEKEASFETGPGQAKIKQAEQRLPICEAVDHESIQRRAWGYEGSEEFLKEPVQQVSKREESLASPPTGGCRAEDREETVANNTENLKHPEQLAAPPSQEQGQEVSHREVCSQRDTSSNFHLNDRSASVVYPGERTAENIFSVPRLVNEDFHLGNPHSLGLDEMAKNGSHSTAIYGTVANSGFGILNTTLTVKPAIQEDSKDDSKTWFHKMSLIKSSNSPAGSNIVVQNGGTKRPIHEFHYLSEVDSYSNFPALQNTAENPERGHLENITSSPREYADAHENKPEATMFRDTDYKNEMEDFLKPFSEKNLDTRRSAPSAFNRESYFTRHEGEQMPNSHMTAPAANSDSKGQHSFFSDSRAEQSWEEPGEDLYYQWYSQIHAEDGSDVDSFSGVFTAKRVEFLPSPPPEDLDSPHEMDSFVDTLRNMDSPLVLRPHRGPRPPRPMSLPSFYSLPPIEEDLPTHDAQAPFECSKSMDSVDSVVPAQEPTKPVLPKDLGLRLNMGKELLSPLEMMRRQKEQDSEEKARTPFTLPMRASADSSIVFRKGSLGTGSPESAPSQTPEKALSSSEDRPYSRLDSSLLFSNYRLTEKTSENGKVNGPLSSSLFRQSSLPDLSGSADKDPAQADTQKSSTFNRFSYLLSPPSSVSGGPETTRISLPPTPLEQKTPTPDALQSKTSLSSNSLDLQKPTFVDMPARISLPPSPLDLMKQNMTNIPSNVNLPSNTLDLHKPVFNDIHRSSSFVTAPETERNIIPKYRAFPDAYLTKEKEHGKLNPRPGKLFIYDQPGFCGGKIEVHSDVIDATPWDLPETIFIRVLRGGWVLYEKPNFKGEKIPLDEGDTEVTCPFGLPEGQEGEPQLSRKFVIGSLRRAVRDYSVPEICLFPEENAEGKKVIFRDTSEDARIFGFPIKANSLIVNAGLWLVFSKPFFEGVPRVLEVGGFPNQEAWGATEPYVGSLHPLKIAEPKVEKPNEPKIIIYEKSYFTGKSREIYTNTRDFMTRVDKQNVFMYSAGSIKVLGGIWVAYEKEGFRGHQYLLEEGDYHDWRVWGGSNSELRSLHLIRADFSDPMMIMFEESENEEDPKTFEVTEAIPDVELFGYQTITQSIHVLSGVWIAYSHVDFSGDQYILEKGFYNSCQDWGATDCKICSVQPVLLAPRESQDFKNEILLFSEPEFRGSSQSYDEDIEVLPDSFQPQSCRVLGGSWVVYEGREFSGNLYVLPEGEYPDFASMGCPPSTVIRSIKTVPIMFTEPSISLFSLECFEGKEISLTSEVLSLLAEGFNNHVLSVRVNSGIWVICEHSNYRGRQILVETIEITNWHKFSELSKIGSLYPVPQKRYFFHIKNKERGHYMSIQGDVAEMKSGRVVVTEHIEGLSHVWYYEDGLIKNKLAPTMSLQVMGNAEQGARVVLWSESRMPKQTWNAQLSGCIGSRIFQGMVLDVKGGKTYDKDHVVIWQESGERPSQQWELQIL